MPLIHIKLVSHFSNNFTTSDNLTQVFCDNGDSVITGGYRMLAITAPLEEGANLVVATDRPMLDPLGSGLEVEIIRITDVSILYNVHAICFDNPPVSETLKFLPFFYFFAVNNRYLL